ncbi:hypothetical protein [Comamonas sp. MYb396]|uniref:hypothetical protein n=1 Tax=Comamonas sp. MYb396 TaxID=2745302 RepID=UPI0030956ECF
MAYTEFNLISNCAAASDGGSLWLSLSGAGGEVGFTLVRSIASRNTPVYGSVISENGLLSPEDVKHLCRRLNELQHSMPMCSDLVRGFVEAALERAAQPVVQAVGPANDRSAF